MATTWAASKRMMRHVRYLGTLNGWRGNDGTSMVGVDNTGVLSVVWWIQDVRIYTEERAGLVHVLVRLGYVLSDDDHSVFVGKGGAMDKGYYKPLDLASTELGFAVEHIRCAVQHLASRQHDNVVARDKLIELPECAAKLYGIQSALERLIPDLASRE